MLLIFLWAFGATNSRVVRMPNCWRTFWEPLLNQSTARKVAIFTRMHEENLILEQNNQILLLRDWTTFWGLLWIQWNSSSFVSLSHVGNSLHLSSDENWRMHWCRLSLACYSRKKSPSGQNLQLWASSVEHEWKNEAHGATMSPLESIFAVF